MEWSRPARSIVLVALAAVLLGCGESARPSPESPGLSIFFPQLPPPTGGLQVSPAAAITGVLTVERGCVWLVAEGGHYLVVWPHSYAPALANGMFVILGPDRSIIAREGQRLRLGGGEVASETDRAQDAVAELTGLEIPGPCRAGQVWNANSIIP